MKDWQDTRFAGGIRGKVAELSTVSAPASVPPPDQEAGADPEAAPEVSLRPNETASTLSSIAETRLSVRKLAQILELVQDLPGGAPVHRDAERLLTSLRHSCDRTERDFADLVDIFLQDRALHPDQAGDARIEWELLRRHLRPPWLETHDNLRARLVALLRQQSTLAPGPAAAEGAQDAAPSASTTRSNVDRIEPERTAQAPRAQGARPDETDIYESRLTAEHEAKIDSLQHSLGREIRDTLSQNQEFGVTLDLVLSELQRVQDIGDAQQLRERLLEQVKRLHTGHYTLAQKLDSADRYLSLLSLDSRNLNEELHRVRELSLTDELTSLPNRRAFMARVEEEVARVQRYGMPLSLAVIDLDHFKDINDRHGHAAGDEVLRCYATQIFSVFRNHDLVARHGGEEFAVLLPNTDHGGAAAALRKARECAARVRCRAEDTAFPVPSFSAGVATFQRGETAQQLIDRADEALYRAKRGGRDRVEFAGGSMS